MLLDGQPVAETKRSVQKPSLLARVGGALEADGEGQNRLPGTRVVAVGDGVARWTENPSQVTIAGLRLFVRQVDKGGTEAHEQSFRGVFRIKAGRAVQEARKRNREKHGDGPAVAGPCIWLFHHHFTNGRMLRKRSVPASPRISKMTLSTVVSAAPARSSRRRAVSRSTARREPIASCKT